MEFAGFFAIQDGPNYEDLDIMDASLSNYITVTANAKLITAAPDLLKACQSVLKTSELGMGTSKRVQDAINKALK